MGDLDRDGVGDLLLGVEGDDTGGTNSGSDLVVSGRTGKTIRSLVGSTPGGRFG